MEGLIRGMLESWRYQVIDRSEQQGTWSGLEGGP